MINVGVEHNGCELLRELAVQSILQLIGEDFYEEHLPGRQGSMIEHRYLVLGDLEEQRGISVHIHINIFVWNIIIHHKSLVQVKTINIL